MEDGNVANFFELLFNVEAVGSLDVLQINSTKSA
jgi:hypothetical protein